ncbi:MAG: hypothetical protein V1773_18460 [bacterium]
MLKQIIVIMLFFFITECIYSQVEQDSSQIYSIDTTQLKPDNLPYSGNIKQEQLNLEDELQSRIFFHSTMGFFERLTVGMGANLNKQNSLLIKYTTVYDGHSGCLALGLRYSYLFDSKIFINTFSLEYGVLLEKRNSKYDGFFQGSLYQFNLGRKTELSSTMSLLIEAGLLAVKRNDEEILFNPNIKIGANYNFSINTFSRPEDVNLQSRIFTQLTIGLCDFLSLGTGYYFDVQNSLMIKYQSVSASKGILPNAENAISLKYTYSFDSKIFIKNVSLTTIGIFRHKGQEWEIPNTTFFQGYGAAITTGTKKKLDSGFSFVFDAGIMGTQIINGEFNIWPVLAIGVNFNF